VAAEEGVAGVARRQGVQGMMGIKVVVDKCVGAPGQLKSSKQGIQGAQDPRHRGGPGD
jgi:hypothetical protein